MSSTQICSATELTGGRRIFELAELAPFVGKDVAYTLVDEISGGQICFGRLSYRAHLGMYRIDLYLATGDGSNRISDLKEQRLVLREATPTEISGLRLSYSESNLSNLEHPETPYQIDGTIVTAGSFFTILENEHAFGVEGLVGKDGTRYTLGAEDSPEFLIAEPPDGKGKLRIATSTDLGRKPGFVVLEAPDGTNLEDLANVVAAALGDAAALAAVAPKVGDSTTG